MNNASTAEETPTRKVGRPKGSKTRAKNGSDPRDIEIAQLREQLARKATLDPIPVAGEEHRPGTYIKVGVDASGAPILAKVRYSKEWLSKNTAQVTFTPARSLVVGPYGISYRLEAEQEFSGPKVVQDFYLEAVRNEKEEARRHPPLSLQEQSDLDARAASVPGKHWSRLFKTASAGLNVRQDTEDIG